ncbi:ROK family transcriptional regulator [Marinomonas algicola]|uniref:ROK family transcriptional regulator n=1 Tax=Marinomonas algicola TaxID=2773454 RepID=UPI001EFF3582|nr:ROK family transcriptional regulator [Marinomonas algicola]
MKVAKLGRVPKRKKIVGLGSTSEQGRRYNERVILHVVRKHPNISRIQIALETGLSAQTISVITSSLLAKGMLQVTGKVKGNRGQPSIMLTICPDGAYGLGINVDRDHISAALLDFSGRCILLKEHSIHFPSQDDAQAIALNLIAEVKAILGEKWGRVRGVGLAKPDFMSLWLDSLASEIPNQDPLTSLRESLRYWETDEFSTWLEVQTNLPCVTENDANAAALNELLLSKASKRSHFFYIFIGSACGGGAVIEGECFLGANARAGNFGLIPTTTGRLGKQILEALSLSSLSRFLSAQGRPFPTTEKDWAEDTIQGLVDQWVDLVCSEILPGIFSVIALFDPQSIVFGGRLPLSVQTKLLSVLIKVLHTHCPLGMNIPNLEIAETAETSGMVGAAILPLYDTFSPHRSLLLV